MALSLIAVLRLHLIESSAMARREELRLAGRFPLGLFGTPNGTCPRPSSGSLRTVITGNGRAGTSFLMALCIDLGLPTGISRSQQNALGGPAHAGLEHSQLRTCWDPAARVPAIDWAAGRLEIIKQPQLALPATYPFWITPSAVAGGLHAIVLTRDAWAAAQSRARNGLGAGGLTYGAATAQEQAASDVTLLGALLAALEGAGANYSVLHYPRHIMDAEYAAARLAPLLAHYGVSRHAFVRAHRARQQPALVHEAGRRPDGGCEGRACGEAPAAAVRAPRPPPEAAPRSLVVYFNIYVPPAAAGGDQGAWTIVREQLRQLHASPIAAPGAELEEVRLIILGPHSHSGAGAALPRPRPDLCARCVEWARAREGTEFTTLAEVQRHCEARLRAEPGDSGAGAEHLVAYLHNKGSFHPSALNELLRRFVTRAAVSQTCAAALQSGACDVCSARFMPLPMFFTPGNMWVARCEYIRRLLPADESFAAAMARAASRLDANGAASAATLVARPMSEYCTGQGRFASEHWVHSHPSVRPCDVYDGPYMLGHEWTLGGPLLPKNTSWPLQLAPAPRFRMRTVAMSLFGRGPPLRGAMWSKCHMHGRTILNAKNRTPGSDDEAFAMAKASLFLRATRSRWHSLYPGVPPSQWAATATEPHVWSSV